MLKFISSARRRPPSVNIGAQYSQWRWFLTSLSDLTDYSPSAVDDSGWQVGAAPFGNIAANPGVGASAHNYDNRLSALMGTQVALNDRLWIRRYVNLPSVPPGGFRLVGYFDNTFQLFINGVLASDGSTSTNAGVTKLLSAGLFVPGVNVVAVRCDDDAAVAPTDACYFDFLLDPIYG